MDPPTWLVANLTKETLDGRYDQESQSARETTQNHRKEGNGRQKAASHMPTREEIEKLARAYWEQRGYQDGFAEQDWLRAEQELLKMAS